MDEMTSVLEFLASLVSFLAAVIAAVPEVLRFAREKRKGRQRDKR